MRGEKVGTTAGTFAVQGSPPHARGKGLLKSLVLIFSRITPACAGKSGFEDLEDF